MERVNREKQIDIEGRHMDGNYGMQDYRELFEAAPVGLAVCRKNGEIQLANCLFYRMMSMDVNGQEKCSLMDMAAVKDRGVLAELFEEAGQAGISKTVQIGFKCAEEVRTVVRIAFLDSDPDYFCCSFVETADIRAEWDSIGEESLSDPMTGLYNRKFYNCFLEDYDERSDLPFAVMVLDINGLKMINDTLGHHFGDKAILCVSQALKKYASPRYMLARVGGDEIVGLFPGTELEEVMEYKKKVEEEVDRRNLAGLNLSFSSGTAVKRTEEEALQVVIHAAEDSMYSQKVLKSTGQKTQTIEVILNTLFEKNPRFREHCTHVSEMAAGFGKYLGMGEEKLLFLREVGYLHDVGMASTWGDFLEKNRPLKRSERLDVKRHPEVGYRILYSVPEHRDKAQVVLYHHENWDGSGYPYHISGKNIPEMARLIHLVDTYDRTRYGYMGVEGKTADETLKEIESESGRKFEPEMTAAFLEWMRQINP